MGWNKMRWNKMRWNKLRWNKMRWNKMGMKGRNKQTNKQTKNNDSPFPPPSHLHSQTGKHTEVQSRSRHP